MDKLKLLYKKYLSNIFAINIVLAIVLNVTIELLARKSWSLLIGYVSEEFFVFLINSIIIFATLSIAILFRRRTFTVLFVSLLWLAIGIVNGVILSQRMTPFTIGDLQAFQEGMEVAITYMPISEILLYIGAAILAIALIIISFIKLPKKKEKVNYIKSIMGVLLLGVLLIGTLFLGIRTGTMDTFFPNLAYGYRDNGVPYSFLSTWLDRGLDKPKGYSEEMIDEIFTEEELNTTVHAEMTNKNMGDTGPNIIFVQLESVIDPYVIEGIEMSADPIPNLRKLMDENPSGLLTVPSMGAGTANTEFEIMTGFSARLFGPGEYPYKTVLMDQTIESYPFVLGELGYATHAVHNHRGLFYGRNEVFANLGYDTFTSLEYMQGIEKTKSNWAKDTILTGSIFDALESTKERDYVYAIGVEGHGKYPTEQTIFNPEIVVTTDLGEEMKWQFEYYVNLCYETDKFIGELITELEEFEEDTVLVIFGDHLPAIEYIDDSTLLGRSMYQTDYVIWSNYDVQYDFEAGDKLGYQLAAEVFEIIGIYEGAMTTLHQNYRDEDSYREKLEALQYDIISGDLYLYDGEIPYYRTDIKLGVRDITIDRVEEIGGKYFIVGENFNVYSKVNLDGEILDTFYISSTLLGLEEKVDPEEASKMKVSQVESGNEILSTTE